MTAPALTCSLLKCADCGGSVLVPIQMRVSLALEGVSELLDTLMRIGGH